MLGRIVKLFISLCFCPFLLAWRAAVTLLGLPSQPPLVILLYHQVRETERSKFAAQMDNLLRIAVPVPLDPSTRSGKRSLQVAVTFDDGIRNILQNALPALVERRIPATIFYPTGYFGKFPDWISRQDPKDESRWVMTVEEAQNLPADLIGVGSHTVSHKKLNRLAATEVFTELGDSKLELERVLGRTVETVAFPYGEYNDQVVLAAREAGYRRAYAADPVWIDGFVVGRVDTGPLDWPLEFRLKALGAYRWLPLAFHVKRLLISRK